VYLPALEDLEVETESEACPPSGGGHERILLVDDEVPIVEMLKAMLEKLGYRVTARFNGPDALEIFQAQPDQFDLVITDMTMPQMTGDRLARRAWEIRPDIPVILCTGYNEMISEDKASAMGIRKFLLKPVDKEELAIAIRSALESAGTPPYLVPKPQLP
jgi:CheY-like chemotaxis protein